MTSSFKKAAEDLEILGMAEEGLEEYNNQLKVFEGLSAILKY